MEEGEKVRQTARTYYKRKDVQKALVAFSQNREVVPRYFESFGKRPDTLQYESDVLSLAENGATSFHASQELWQDPLQIKTDMREEDVNNLRVGWDLIIDIDTKYLDYGKITAELLIEALRFHNVNSVGVKYSGSRGFHLGISCKAFPEKIAGKETKNFFPEGARAITTYLYGIIKSKLSERVSDMAGVRIRDAVLPDLVLVSPRHLFRMPYSLHEKTSLASIVIKPEQIASFQPGWAKPDLIYPKPFLPVPDENEARELLVQALDFTKKVETEVKTSQYSKGMQREKVVIKDFSPEICPPCISLILKGLKQDGRKRALFALMNYFKSLNLDYEEIEKRVIEWNKLNYTPLRGGYVKAQLSWSKRQKAILPPNCDKTIYEEIGVCHPDALCGAAKTIKNPVNYTIRKVRLINSQSKGRTYGRGNKRE